MKLSKLCFAFCLLPEFQKRGSASWSQQNNVQRGPTPIYCVDMEWWVGVCSRPTIFPTSWTVVLFLKWPHTGFLRTVKRPLLLTCLTLIFPGLYAQWLLILGWKYKSIQRFISSEHAFCDEAVVLIKKRKTMNFNQNIFISTHKIQMKLSLSLSL